jgi:hypothetical protein
MLPLVALGSLQQAIAFFSARAWEHEMRDIRLLLDEETPQAVRYCASSLLPILGGDRRFSVVTPLEWVGPPKHALYERALHSEAGFLRPQDLFGPTEWVSSVDYPVVQIADAAAWVVRRAVARPDEDVARRCFDLLRPSLSGENGDTFQLFAMRRIGPDDEAIYEHLRKGEEPVWWLRRV